MDPHCLPTEMFERIIELIPDATDVDECKLRESKGTILTCALVCKAWMVLARRRLLFLYFPIGKITMKAEPEDTLFLVGVFRSPLCTLDPAFIKVLDFDKDDFFETPDRTDLFAALSALDARPFPSLQTIRFWGDQIRPHEGDDGGAFHYPVRPLLSQIKSLTIRTRSAVPFEDVILIVRLCSSIERVEVSSILGDGYEPIDPFHNFPGPPTSLRELAICVQAVPEITKWMMGRQRNHTNISSLTISSSWWNNDIECHYLRSLLNGIGSNLEELTLKVHEYEAPFVEFEVRDPGSPLDQFKENTSIKRFALMTDLSVAVKLLRYIFEQPHFAPRLEILEVTILSSHSTETYLEKLILLDRYVHLRPLLRRVAFSCPWSGPTEDRGGVEGRIIKQCLAQWEEKVTVELRLT